MPDLSEDIQIAVYPPPCPDSPVSAIFTYMLVDIKKSSHNPKVSGSNPLPATKIEGMKNQGYPAKAVIALLLSGRVQQESWFKLI